MFCKDCGAQLASDTRFCPHCGSAQAVTPPNETITPPTEPDFADKVRATAKKVGSSTAFLVATICITFVQIFGLLTMTPAGNSFEAYSDIFAAFGTAGLKMLASLENLSLVTDILGMIPSILITLGLWITFFSCTRRKPKVNTAGLTMIFAVNLVQMVLSCLILLSAMSALAAIYACADFLPANDDIVETIALAVGLVLLMIFAFVLVYYIKVCTTISNIRSTLKTGVPNKKASRFVAILCHISGGILIFSGIFSLLSAGIVTLDSYYDESLSYALPYEIFLSAVTSLLTATAQIIFGALLFTYRRKMKTLEEEDRLTTFQTLSYAEPYTAPVYIPPEPAAEPAVIAEPATEENFDETKRWDL